MNSIKSIQVQLTSKCNQKCIMCRKYTWPKREVSLKVLEKLFKKYPNATFTFSGGDPLEYPHLGEMMQLIFVHDIKYQVLTNLAYDITPDRLEFLLFATYVQVSFDGSNAKTYNAIRRGGEEQYELVIRNLRLLKNQIRFKLNSTISVDNLYEIRDLAVSAHELGIPIRFFPVHTHEDLKLTEQMFETYLIEKSNQGEHLGADAYDNTNLDEFMRMLTRERPPFCIVKMHHLVVDEAGNEYPCCRAINDNGVYHGTINAIDVLPELYNPNRLYDFCKECDRYVNANLNWETKKHERWLFL